MQQFPNLLWSWYPYFIVPAKTAVLGRGKATIRDTSGWSCEISVVPYSTAVHSLTIKIYFLS